MTPEEIAALQAENAKLKTELHRERVGAQLLGSKFARTLKMPADMIQATFVGSFQSDGGRTVAVDDAGAKLYSRRRPGELADIDEALELLVTRHPHRDLFLNGSAGSPAANADAGAPAANAGAGGRAVYTRQAFDALTPAQPAAVAKSASAGAVVIVD